MERGLPSLPSHEPRGVGAPRPEALQVELLPPDDDGRGLRELWHTLVRRRRWIAAFAVACVLAAALHALFATPLYTAQSLVMIQPDAPKVLDIPEVLGQAASEQHYYETQYELLSSRGLAAKVIEKLDADAGGPPAPGVLARARQWLARRLGPEPSPAEVLEARIDDHLDHLVVEPVRETRLVLVGYSDPDSARAARVANTHADLFIREGMLLQTRAAEEAGAFLETRLEDLKQKVLESQAALARYRREHGIVSPDENASTVVAELAELSNRLTSARAERVAAETEYQLSLRLPPGELPAVLASPLVAALKESIARLEAEHASLASRFAPGYPRLAQLTAQLAESRRRLDREIATITGGLESSYLAAKAREDELAALVERQKEEVLRFKDDSVQLAMLQVDADAHRRIYDEVRTRIKETGMAAQLHASNIFVVERAAVPIRPSGLGAAAVLALALALGLLGGVGLALLADFFDGRVRSSEEMERRTGLATLGEVPDLAPAAPAAERRLLGAGLLLLGSGRRAEPEHRADPARLAAEAYRTIRTNILLSRAGEPPRTLLVTSGGEGEGKTTTTVNLARAFAQLGGPVLLIDADLRRPACHRVLGVANDAGLTEALTGATDASTLLQRIEGDLFFLAAGKRAPSPTELLGSQAMLELIAKARERFDYVLLDAAPVAPVSDAVVLCGRVDGVVLVADRTLTSRDAVKAAQARLAYARAKVLGTVLNRAEVDSSAYAYVLDWEPGPDA